MVTLFDWVRRDWRAFRENVRHSPPPSPGMYTYRFTPPGGRRRVHLRIEPGGRGILLVDASDVIHLNRTATEIVKWALDGVPRDQALTKLTARNRNGYQDDMRTDLTTIYLWIARLRHPDRTCPTCTLDTISRRPLFSTPVHAPYKADLAITYQCNNDCPHCYNEVDRLTLKTMPVQDWKQVVDRLYQIGVPHVIFTGGEATLYKDLPELVEYADRLGPVCGLNSNGRRLADPGYANSLATAGLNHLQVTLGSHDANVHNRMMHTDCFDQTIRGIQNAQAAGIHTITNTTLMHMNAGEIDKTVRFLHDLGIHTFAMNGMIYSGGGFETGEAIAEQRMPAILIRVRDLARRLGMRFLWYTPTEYCRLSPVELEIGAKRCNAAEYSICVEPNADVLPCQSYYASVGNLLRDPWQEIWNSNLFRGFRNRQLDPQRYGLPEKCWKCPDLPLCGGGCRIEREAAQGNRTSGSGTTDPCGGCGSAGSCGNNSQAARLIHLPSLGDESDQDSSKNRPPRHNTRRGSGNFSLVDSKSNHHQA